MTSTMTRRAAIGRAAIATAATALAAVPAIAAPAQVDPLIALGAAVLAADRRNNEAWRREDEARYAAREAGFRVGHPSMMVGTYDCCSVREIRRAAEEAGFSADRSAELVTAYRRRLAERHRQSVAAGLRPVEIEARSAEREWGRAMRAIIATPAISYAGLAVKLRLIKAELEDGISSHGPGLAQSAYNDALRLARAA